MQTMLQIFMQLQEINEMGKRQYSPIGLWVHYLSFATSIPIASGRSSSQGPSVRQVAQKKIPSNIQSSSLSPPESFSILNTATFPPRILTLQAYPAAG